MRLTRKYLNTTTMNTDVIERDNQCLICGSNKNLTVHHIGGIREYPFLITDMDNVVCLCDNCHKDFHKKNSEVNPYTWTKYILQRKHNMATFMPVERRKKLINNEIIITILTEIRTHSLDLNSLKQHMLTKYDTTEEAVTNTVNKLLQQKKIILLEQDGVEELRALI